jgi:hypothetical protein
MDRDEFEDYSNTDLVKRELNYEGFRRFDVGTRVAHLDSCRSELDRFCELSGAACTYFVNHNNDLDLRPLAKVGDRLVGMALEGNEFFLPTLLPEAHRISEYFQILAEAIVAIRNKLLTDIPPWVEAFKFPQEMSDLERLDEIAEERRSKEAELELFKEFKRVLVADGEALVNAVVATLREGFAMEVNSTDERREDIKIQGTDGKPILFGEIKGTNAGVKREYINQADSHRERAGLTPSFPTILIINTHMKNARTVAEKDQPVPAEQIAHATKIRVLILRTLDLVRLLRQMQEGKVDRNKVLEVLCSKVGWLKCGDETFEIVSSQ